MRPSMTVGFLRYLASRLLAALVLVWLVASGALLLVRAAPGDPSADLLGRASTETLARERARAGFDRPVMSLYADWLSRAVRFDFGTSGRYARPVVELLRERALNTAALASTALLVATLLGLPLGVFTGSGHGPLRRAVRAASVLLVSLPPFIMALLLAFAAARTRWFPTGGLSTPGLDTLGDRVWHLALPALALALPVAAMLERLQARAVRDQLEATFVRAARARGVSFTRVLWGHAWRTSLGPVLGIYGIVIGGLFSGSFAVEMVMAWPGLGRLTYDALVARDVNLAAGCASAGAVFLAAGTLAADLLLAAADPRTRERA